MEEVCILQPLQIIHKATLDPIAKGEDICFSLTSSLVNTAKVISRIKFLRCFPAPILSDTTASLIMNKRPLCLLFSKMRAFILCTSLLTSIINQLCSFIWCLHIFMRHLAVDV